MNKFCFDKTMNIQSPFNFVYETVSKYAPKVGACVNGTVEDTVYGIAMKGPLEKDTMHLKGLLSKLFERKEGYACTYFDFQKEKEILEKLPVFKNNNTFGIKEYKNLTSQERQYLDGLLNEVYCNVKPDYTATQTMARTVNEDADFLINISDEIKKSLDTKYPQGYKMVGVGGSPAIFSKIYQQEGMNVKNIPFNKDSAGCDFDYLTYFKNMGLDENFLKNSPEKIVFVDYVKTGKTFDNLRETLNKYGLIDKSNTDFVSLMSLLDRKIPYKDYKLMGDYYFEQEAIKSFCPCPDMSSTQSWINADKIQEGFNWSNSTKLINYGILKKLESAGRLNV